MRLLTVLALMVAMLAGCSDEPATEAADEPAFDDIELEATEETGVIRGVVIDQTITPIAGAKVVLRGPGLETTSNANGAFGFSNLEPGTYFLEIGKVGFGTVQQSTEVVAGVAEPEVVKVLLEADPSSLPFVTVFQWDGRMVCGLSAIALCGLPVIDETVGEDFLTVFEIDQPGIDYLQSEMIWESTQSVSPNMQLWQEAIGEGGCAFEAQNSPSPNLINTTWGDYNTHGDRECFETLGNTTNLRLRTFSGSIDGTFPPTANGCYPPIPGVIGSLCMGVGVTIEQDFTVFNHLFYGFKPPEGWQFSVDGDIQPPQ